MPNKLPIDQTFGNYSVHGIDEIVISNPVSWAPATPAWNGLFALLLLLSIYFLFRLYKNWKANAYRRRALHRIEELKQLHLNNTANNPEAIPTAVLRELPTLMKAAALQAFPRSEVASLSGEHWLKFLNGSFKEAHFQNDTAEALLHIAYIDEEHWAISIKTAQRLIIHCERWLAGHSAHKPGTGTDIDHA